LEKYRGLTIEKNGRPVFTGEVRMHEDRLKQPLRWKKQRTVFVNSMSDLFHEGLPFDFIAEVFAVMSLAEKHTFQILTKRPQRAREFFEWIKEQWPKLFPISKPNAEIDANVVMQFLDNTFNKYIQESDFPALWPLPNVWLGVSVEDQAAADERVPVLLDIPVAVRFVSYEPALGPVDFAQSCGCVGICSHEHCLPFEIDWVICGGESGPNARPMHPDWARSVRDQCVDMDVPFFFKQWGVFVPGDQVTEFTLTLLSTSERFDNPDYIFKNNTGFPCDDIEMFKVGKKKAGRCLDGELWDQYPEVKHD
jgi:protein gp37